MSPVRSARGEVARRRQDALLDRAGDAHLAQRLQRPVGQRDLLLAAGADRELGVRGHRDPGMAGGLAEGRSSPEQHLVPHGDICGRATTTRGRTATPTTTDQRSPQ